MFGYLVAAADVLEESQKARYKATYCGLCKSLERCFGQSARLTLNYDVTFLVLLLSSLYEPEEAANSSRCIRHPIEAQNYISSEISDYAAHMNVALAYLKCLDNWQDEKKASALLEAKLLKGGYDKVCKLYPRQCMAMEKALAELGDIEKQGLEAPDAAADCFGRLMEELFIYKQDRWEPVLRAMAKALGRFIYLMDAVMDLEDDQKSGSYNPFKAYCLIGNKEEHFADILKMQLGECVYYFDKLPLVEDAGLMKNILCIGLWLQFNKKYRKDS